MTWPIETGLDPFSLSRLKSRVKPISQNETKKISSQNETEMLRPSEDSVKIQNETGFIKIWLRPYQNEN